MPLPKLRAPDGQAERGRATVADIMRGAGTPATDLIHTPDQRLRVFVSSTLQELAPERQAVRDAVTSLRLNPVMFELGAWPHPARQVYRAYPDAPAGMTKARP